MMDDKVTFWEVLWCYLLPPAFFEPGQFSWKECRAYCERKRHGASWIKDGNHEYH
jgi:hypothetical protein